MKMTLRLFYSMPHTHDKKTAISLFYYIMLRDLIEDNGDRHKDML